MPLETDFDAKIRYLEARNIRYKSMLFTTLLLYSLLAGVYFLGFPIKRHIETRTLLLERQIEGYKVIPNISEQIVELEKRMSKLNANEIQARVKKIEEALGVGNLSIEDIRKVSVLSKEVAEIKSLMSQSPEQVFGIRTLQADYSSLREQIGSTMDKESILREIGHLEKLVGWTLAVQGIFVSILIGGWFITNRKVEK